MITSGCLRKATGMKCLQVEFFQDKIWNVTRMFIFSAIYIYFSQDMQSKNPVRIKFDFWRLHNFTRIKGMESREN